MSATKHKTIATFGVFEEARETVVRLSTLQKFLSPADEESLALLMDKKFMKHLEQSLDDVKKGKVEALSSVLD